MERTLADGRLTRALRFTVATDADGAGLRRLLRDNPMRGTVSVTFEREPDYFRGTGVAGGEDQTIVAHEDNHLVCMGRCTRRPCWVNGRAQSVAYLAELRLDSRARRRFRSVRDGYRFFREQSRDELLFTSIASDNLPARRLLESGRRGLPFYQFLGELVTLLIGVPRQARASRLRLVPATAADLPAIVRLFNEQGRRHQFATVWTEECLRGLAAHGLPLERILLAKMEGRCVAGGALWDQRSFRQTVIHGYAGWLRLALPLVNAASRVLGRPRLPASGTTLAQAFLSPIAFAAGGEELLSRFVEASFPYAASAGVQWLTLALPAADARVEELRRRFYTQTWRSRLYRVHWAEVSPPEELAICPPLLPDVALL